MLEISVLKLLLGRLIVKFYIIITIDDNFGLKEWSIWQTVLQNQKKKKNFLSGVHTPFEIILFFFFFLFSLTPTQISSTSTINLQYLRILHSSKFIWQFCLRFWSHLSSALGFRCCSNVTNDDKIWDFLLSGFFLDLLFGIYLCESLFVEFVEVWNIFASVGSQIFMGFAHAFA